MDSRKIQQIGSGTFTVSLPQEWAQAEDLGQGDVVDIHTHIDGVLAVQTRDRETEPTGSIRIELGDADTEHVLQSLWTAYTAGYTEITLTTQSAFTESQRRVASEVANVLAGAAVRTAATAEIAVRVLLDPEEISVRQLVRQLSFVAISMHRRAVAAVANERLEFDVADRDDQADRLFAMTERSFVRALSRLDEIDALGVTRPELFELWSTARDLERVADHAERISMIASGFEEPLEEDHVAALQQLAGSAQDVVDYAVEGVIEHRGTDSACEALMLRTDVREEVTELDRRLFGDTTADYRLARILDGVHRTAEHGGNIAERGLQRAVRGGDEVSLACTRRTADVPETASTASGDED